MRALLLDEDARAKIQGVLEFAHKPENYYIIGPGGFSLQRPPGDDPRHVVHLNTFRCVFSVSKADGKLWKHLSVSVPGNKYPNPFAVYTIAQEFGFTGWDGNSEVPPVDWAGRLEQEVRAVVLAQELRAAKEAV